jgi:hypothetical protein
MSPSGLSHSLDYVEYAVLSGQLVHSLLKMLKYDFGVKHVSHVLFFV